MNYEIIRDKIEDMVSNNHKDFVKAVISMEKGINDEDALDKLYDAYMENDSAKLLNEEFDVMIEELREQGQIKDIPYTRKEKDELVDIVGNIAGKVDVVERENKKGKTFKVVNFSVVSNDSLGNKVYHSCSAYGEKCDIPKTFKQGDFVKLFGQVRISADGNGKEYRNVNILSSKLLKAKEQNKEITATSEKEKLNNGIMGREKTERESVKDAIKKYKGKDNGMPQSRKEIIKEMKDKYLID
ncbi:MAG: DNA-binding protein [Catonella sp.]|uniref:DNA-binding protein n=1 Tax=Catonella sp. TaxID=2382125 RepID=UPI003F9FB422